MADPRLVLASGSPRRAELLSRFGVAFAITPADVDETVTPGERPVDHVGRLADAKADAVIGGGGVVVGADTVVDVDGSILGKPVDDRDAHRMLNVLSGRSHRVHTAVTVWAGGRRHRGLETTEVELAPLSPERIGWYVATGEPRDKAGAYAIQGIGALFVVSVNGCVTNVIGLPLPLVDRLLATAGFDLTATTRA